MDVTNRKHLDILKSLLQFCRPCGYRAAHVHVHERNCYHPISRDIRHPSLCERSGMWKDYHTYQADLLKVQIANTLYKAAIELLEVCRQLGICISIENPLRSWLWMLLAKYIKETNNIQLIQWYSELECVTFDACAHGSNRDKRTKLLATHGVFSDLEQDCPSNHQHASWTPFQMNKQTFFPTATKAEYPALLCSRMADWQSHATLMF